jgi:hypothetical protein
MLIVVTPATRFINYESVTHTTLIASPNMVNLLFCGM